MASKYYVTLRLDPHYQRFLRSQFNCEDEIFEFPPRHFFNTMLEHFTSTRQADYVEPDKDCPVIKIALPNFEYKNPAHFRFLTKVKETVFKSKIKEYYDWIIQEKIERMMKYPGALTDGAPVALNRNECTLILIDEYKFDAQDQNSFDRLYKLFTRYKKKEVNRKFCHKKKELQE